MQIEKGVSFFLDKEDEKTVVDEAFKGFQELYRPIIESAEFKDVLQINSDGKFEIDSHDKTS